MLFKDRRDAGGQLALKLSQYKDKSDLIVLGLARGGVITAAQVADALHLPLDVLIVRKISAPGNEELALGAIAQEGEEVFNDHLIGLLGVCSDYLKKETERQRRIIKERLILYREAKPTFPLQNKTVILVDDGIATGASMRAAIATMHRSGVKKIVIAVPVAPPDSLRKISSQVDEVICLSSPVFFESLKGFYRLFDQISDQEVMGLLSRV